MQKIKVINNGTVLVNSDFIMDPWIYGNLYNNSWSPFPKNNFDKKKLKKIKYCFISHLHQDHWDLDTIKHFDKKIKFFLPKLPFNKVIEKGLNKYGFKNISYIKYGKFEKISDDYEIAVVPPLNKGALETDIINPYDDNAIAIDTGLILKSTKLNINHLILFDNSPYDINIFKNFFKNIKIHSLFFNYNGFAQDYPLKYNMLSPSQKKKISYNLQLKKEKYIVNFINYIKPKTLVPHSSDFILNQNRKLFFSTHSKDFLDKHKYAERINKITKIKTFALYSKDTLFIDKNNFHAKIKTNNNERNLKNPQMKLSFPKGSVKKFENVLSEAFDKMLERIKTYNLTIPKSKLGLDFGNSKYLIDFKKKTITKNKFSKKDILILLTKKSIFKLILERKIHINNATIGCYLNWERYPNKYLNFRDLYQSLNFFHI